MYIEESAMADKARMIGVLKAIGVWVLTVPVALVFVMVGTAKLRGSAPWPNYFDAWGYAVWFRMLIGVLQAGCGLLLLIPPLAAYGAGILVAVMTGAVFTELTNEIGFGARTPTIYILVLLALFMIRRSRRLRLPSER